MAAPDRCSLRRRGVTLIELLVVVAVMAILLGAVLHMMRPVMKEMKVREAARMVNAFLVGAQSRAMELDRPVAVYIEPFVRKAVADGEPQPTGAAFQMFIAESPLPFAGDTVNAVATIGAGSGRSSATLGESSMLANFKRDEIIGGFIRFNFRGHFYEIRSWTGDQDIGYQVGFYTNQNEPSPSHPSRFQEPPAPAPQGTPYQIFPRPIKTSAAPLDIPEPLAIDIGNCGVGKDHDFNVTRDPIVVSFDPSGAIHRVYGNLEGESSEVFHPKYAVHLMIGWADQLAYDSTKRIDNREDYTTRWVSISHLTGRIITSENAGILNGADPRDFAEDALGMGSGI